MFDTDHQDDRADGAAPAGALAGAAFLVPESLVRAADELEAMLAAGRLDARRDEGSSGGDDQYDAPAHREVWDSTAADELIRAHENAEHATAAPEPVAVEHFAPADLERLAAEAVPANLTSGSDLGAMLAGHLRSHLWAQDELRRSIEVHFVSRSEQDQQQTDILKALQQQIVHLTDKIAAIERATVAPSGTEGYWGSTEPAWSPVPSLAWPPEQEPLAAVYHHPPRSTGTALDGSGLSDAELGLITGSFRTNEPVAHAHTERGGAATAHSEPDVAPPQDRGHAVETDERAPPLVLTREDFVAAARRAAMRASEPDAAGKSASKRARTRTTPDGSAGGRTPAFSGLVAAGLALLLALGAGLTTYGVLLSVATAVPKVENGMRSAGDAAAGDPEVPRALDGRQEQAGRQGAGSAGSPQSLLEGAQGANSGGSPASAGRLEPQAQSAGDMPAMAVSTVTTAAIDANPPSTTGEPPAGVASLPVSGADAAAPVSRPLQRDSGAKSVTASALQPQLPPDGIGSPSLRTAAERGDPSAEFAVAVQLAEGNGVQPDLQQAFVWFQRSASRGFAPAQYRIASMFERGVGVRADPARARVWYQRAAEQQHVNSMHNLAVLAARGDGGPADYVIAALWFAEAAERGLRDSQFNLAILHENGMGVPRDLAQAYKWFALAAQAGDKDAQLRKEQIATKLDAPTRAIADGLVKSWRAKPVSPLVNDARAAAAVWRERQASNG